MVIGCFIHLLVTPYDLYLELKFKDYTFIFPQICWMISHILRLFLVVEPCHAASQGVSRSFELRVYFNCIFVGEASIFIGVSVLIVGIVRRLALSGKKKIGIK